MSAPATPAPPDYGPLVEASAKAADRAFELQERQFEWAKEAYARDSSITNLAVDAFMEAMSFNQQNAEKDRSRYESEFQPLEDQLIQDAQDYASPERRAQEQGRAQAEVGQQFDAARQNAERQLESYGINPSATRYAALDIGVRTQEAAAKAAASDAAARSVDEQGRALRSEAINIGRGLPGQVIASTGAAAGAGSGAVGNQLATTGSGASTMGTPAQYGAMGTSAVGQWGNILNTGYNNQLNAYTAQQEASTGIGDILGLAGGLALKKFGFDEGGAVPVEMSPSRGAKPDDVPGALTAGEFVIPEEAVRWHGEKFFSGLIEKAKTERAERMPPPQAIPMPARAHAAIPMR